LFLVLGICTQIVAPLLGGGAVRGTAVRLALVIMAAARTCRHLAGDRRKAVRMV
jgi:hypothetical protein